MRTYKNLIAIGLMLASLSSFSDEQNDAWRELINGVDAAWTNRDYAEILTLAENRLTSDSNDVLALCIKQNYYLWCDNNATNVHNLTHQITNIVWNSARDEVKAEAMEKATNYINLPMSDSEPYTETQRNELHAEFTDSFPGIIDCVNFAYRFHRSKDIYVESQNPTNVYVQSSHWDATGDRDGTTTLHRIYHKGMEVTFTAPSSTSNSLFSHWLKDGVLYSTTNAITFTVETNTTFTVVYTNAP